MLSGADREWIGIRSGADQEQIPSLLSDWFREVTWILGGDPLGSRSGVDQEWIHFDFLRL